MEDCLGGVDFDNVFLSNVTRGIHARNSGRLDIRRLRGQVLRTGVEIDQCLDIPRIHSVHFWPFWSSDDNIIRWEMKTHGKWKSRMTEVQAHYPHLVIVRLTRARDVAAWLSGPAAGLA